MELTHSLKNENKNGLSNQELIATGLFLLICVSILFWEAILKGQTILPVGNIFEQPFYKSFAPINYKGYPNYLLFDQSNQLYPLQQFAMEAMHEGRMPLWNPNIMLGVPILGTTQTAVLYPINLLAGILSPLSVILIRCIFNLWFAGFSTYILVRKLGAKYFGALISALAFMFSGFLIVWLGHPHSNAAIWLPFMILMAEFIATSNFKSGLYASLTGLFIALSFFGGHMETTFSITIAWFLYFIIRSFQINSIKSIKRTFGIAIFSLLIGVFLAAIQIIPFLEWLSNSAALVERGGREFNIFYIGFWRNLLTLPTLLIPNLFSNPSQTDPYQSYLPWTNFNEFSMYVGIIPILLGVLGLCIKQNKIIKIFTLGAFIFLALALKIPLLDYINELPVFRMFASGRYRLIFDFGIAVGAGLTFDAIMSKSYHLINWKFISKTLLLIGLIVLVFIFSISFILPFFEKMILELGKNLITEQYNTIKVHSRSLNEVLVEVDRVWYGIIKHFNVNNWKLYFPALIAMLGAIWIYIWQNNFFDKIVFQIGVVFLVLIDLLVFGIGYNPSINAANVYPNTPAVNFLKKDSTLFRILPTTMQWRSNGPLAYGFNEIGGCELPTKYYHNFRNTIATSYPFPTSEYSTGFTSNSANSKLIDLLNTKYIITTKEMDTTIRKDIKIIWQENKIRIYKNNKSLPRAFFVNKVQYLSDDSTLKTLSNTLFDPASEVLLPLLQDKNIILNSMITGSNSVMVTKYLAENVQISTNNSDNGLLVLSDSYYPGWHAFLDGKDVPIFRANYVMRAIYLPKGKHKIEFKYEPISVYIGIAISITTLLIMLILSMLSYIKYYKQYHVGIFIDNSELQ